MFCNINTVPLSSVDPVSSLLSAAEMLEDTFPDISGSFITYAFLLCEDYFSRNPSNPESDESFSELKDLSTISTNSSSKELEQFGDSILAAAEDSPLPQEMYRLAYISYASTSIHGVPSQRISQKLKRIESKMEKTSHHPKQQKNQNRNSSDPKYPVYPVEGIQYIADDNKFVNDHAPKYATNVQPTVHYGQPSAFSIQDQQSIIQYPQPSSLDKENGMQPQGFPLYPSFDNNAMDIVAPHQRTKCEELVAISREAFKRGSLTVAYAALTAALQELESKK